ncbi:ribosomal RNA small subunit methyltransferase, mitochondrial-like [Bidens hawaiensis]|uniref:ribosomal RNA small subunit methyltransferase, mitochondrial-like n=1 Tax=Bidens hawaiensis TaxID=980011 RepID=UPI004049206E
MLQCAKSSVNRHFLLKLSVQFHQLHAKHTHPPYNNRHHDEDDNNFNRTQNQNQEDRFQLYKSWGQHLLTNPRVLDSIIRNSGVGPGDTVLEIGPGTGNLTMRLLEAAKKVVAVEVDNRMVQALQTRVAEHGFDEKLSIIHKDALKADFPDFDLVVANIPYGISSPLVAKFVFGGYNFRSATLLLQKEFATRLLANPGDSEFNRLAVNVKLVADVEHVMNVSKKDFVPMPKVDSSVVKISLKTEIPDVNLNEWWAFTKTCFGKKNKTLGATFRQKKKVAELLNLSKVTSFNGDIVEHECCNESDDEEDECEILGTEVNLFKEKLVGILRTAGLEDKRPSKLSNGELLYLLSLFNKAGIWFHDQEKPRDINASFAGL